MTTSPAPASVDRRAQPGDAAADDEEVAADIHRVLSYHSIRPSAARLSPVTAVRFARQPRGRHAARRSCQGSDPALGRSRPWSALVSPP